MALASGTRLGPYRIVAPLGVGRMGEVYRAKDTRLDREVAIKVLPEEFFKDQERKGRFEREAKLLAAVNHPNIAAIYSFEEISGRSLLVQELLEGDSLSETLSAGPLPPRKAIEYGVEIAHGLAAAHAKGIVHRDLKPANVFITGDDVVKLLDFGLARQVAIASDIDTQSPTAMRDTEPGVVMGTVGYLSPEQVRGGPADARSDIFALGCVLYEMLAGCRAFSGKTPADTMAAILREDPASITGLGREIVPALRTIVQRCLEKRPADRFSSAHDLALALQAFSGGEEVSSSPVPGVRSQSLRHRAATLGLAAAAMLAAAVGAWWWLTRLTKPTLALEPGRIAVLPFENLGAAQDAYFADGMTDEVRGKLSELSGLAVIGRSSSDPYKGTTKPAWQIAEELGASYGGRELQPRAGRTPSTASFRKSSRYKQRLPRGSRRPCRSR